MRGFALLTLVLGSCALADVDLSGLPCPCSGSDYACDAATNTCIRLVSGPFALTVTPGLVALGRGRSASIVVELQTTVAQTISVEAIDLPKGVATTAGSLALSKAKPRGELMLTSDTSTNIGTNIAHVQGKGPTGDTVTQPLTIEIGGRSGTLDPSFGDNGIATVTGVPTAIFPRLALMSDDRIVLTGIEGGNCFVARVTADGKVDTSFGANGVTLTPGPTGKPCYPQALVVQADGKTLVAGDENPVGSGYVWRYGNDGKLDPSFGQSGVATVDAGVAITQLTAITRDQQGRILVTGYAGADYTSAHIVLARLVENGSLDASFGTGGFVRTTFAPDAESAADLIVLADGRIVVAGERQSTPPRSLLLRLSDQGALDTSFGLGGVVVGADMTSLSRVRAAANGDLLAGGTFTNGMTPFSEMGAFFSRYLDSGVLDAKFGAAGTRAIMSMQPPSTKLVGLTELPSGELAVCDQSFFTELSSIGQSDAQVGIVAASAPMEFTDMAVQSNGKLVMAGGVYNGALELARYWP